MKEKIIIMLLVTIILMNILCTAIVIKPSFAENTISKTDLREVSETTQRGESESVSGQKASRETSRRLSHDDECKWNFTDTSEWSKYAYADGNKTRLIVGVNDEKPSSFFELEKAADKHGARIVNTISIKGVVRAVAIELSFASVPVFVEEIHVAELASYVEPNMKVQAQLVPNDPYWSIQWGPQKVQADWAWNTTVGSPAILVAVVDTGIDYTHPDLAANYEPLGYDWVNNDPDPLDDHGHGTHCAGIVAAVADNGVGIAGLAQVHVMAEKVLDSGGGGYWDWVANGIIHATDSGAKIISMSLGGYGDSELVHDAIRYAYESGVLVVAAAGNDNTNMMFYPAAYDEVLAVAATDQYDQKSWFSNWGDWIDLAAPGVDIYSTVPWGYESWSGTSMACPHVSGVAALVWSHYSNRSREWLRLWLQNAVDDLGELGFDKYYGWGRVNARKAVEQIPPVHELIAYNWITPPYVKPGATGTINATILDFGESNETSVEVQLLANSTLIGSVVVDLVSGTTRSVSFIWNPTIQGLYNVTLYVVPVLGETNSENNLLWKYIYVGSAVKAVVLHSAGNIQSNIITNWQVLSSEWYLFGDTMVYVDYTTLNKEEITFDDIAATDADVLLISCAYDPYAGWQFSDTEIEAIKQYVQEGHGLIATAGTFYDQVPNNNKLAPFFGLNPTTMWTGTGTDLLHLLNASHPLFNKIPNPLVFPSVGTALPYDGRWDSNELAGGKYLATGHYQESAVVTCKGLVYISAWLEVIPPYYHHHLQLLYNAILWSKYQRPDHELRVSLQAPEALKPGHTALLNATVSNMGVCNETSVQLQLLINGTATNSTTIPMLLSGGSYALRHLWAPTVEGTYNITAYVVPMPGEEEIANNAKSESIVVSSLLIALFQNSPPWGYSSNEEALQRYNIPYSVFSSADFGRVDLDSYTKVVIASDQDQPFYDAMDTYRWWFENYVNNGGILEIHAADYGWHGGHWIGILPGGLQWMNYYGQYVTVIDPTHPLLTTPNVIPEAELDNWGYSIHGYFTSFPSDAQITIIEDYTLMPVYLEFRYGSGFVVASSQPLEFVYGTRRSLILENSLLYLPAIYEHDLAVRLDAPTYMELGNPVVLTATVRNRGLYNETNLELRFLVNGTVVYFELVPELFVGESRSVQYLWSPTAPASYNVTVYAPPVAEETHTINNIVSRRVFVYFYMRLYLPNEWIGGGNPMGWHADDSSWQYTLPFDFPFYGVSYRTIYISSNGLITFNGPDSSYWNSIPDLAGRLAITPAWDDWLTYDPYDIYIWEDAAQVGIRWNVRSLGTGAVANFEAVLRADGLIRFNYESNDGPISATIGISNGAGHILAEDVTSVDSISTIVFTPFLPEHDLEVSLDIPAQSIEPGTTVLLNATVRNCGRNNETNIELCLLINGSIVSSATTPELVRSQSFTINYSWTPVITSVFNVTAYSPPMPGEEFLGNNIVTDYARVHSILARVAVLNSWDMPSYFYGGWGNDFQSLVDLLLASSFYAQPVTNDEITSGILSSFDVFVMIDNVPNDAAVPVIFDFWLNGGGIVTFDSSICFLCYAGILPSESIGSNGAYVYWGYDTSSEARVSAEHPVTAGYEVGQTVTGTGGDADYWVSALSSTSAYPYYVKLVEDLANPDLAYVSAYEPPFNGKVVQIWDAIHSNNLNLRLMITNAMEWTSVKREHDLAVRLSALPRLSPGNSVLLNATVRNSGLNNETGVQLLMFINSTLVDSITVTELPVARTYELSYLWTPPEQAVYNVTAYAPPVPGEEYTANNVAARLARVMKGYILFDQTHFVDSIADYSIWVESLTERGYAIETHNSGLIISTILRNFDVLVIPQAHQGYTADELSAIQDFVMSGGGLLVIGDDEPWYYTSLTSFAGLTWSRGGISGITTDIAAHPATEGVTSVYFAGVSSQISVGFPATDLIRDQEGNTLLAASEVGSGKALAIADEDSINNDYVLSVDNLRLANAIIDWIASPRSEHELAVSLVVPASLERASALLNATVANRGLRNETDLYLYLIINGTTVGSATIPELLVNELYDFSFEWAPTKAGVYNITAYVTIVPGESYAGNNIITKWSDVSARLLGDLNGDGIVNIQDVVLVSGIYGSTIGEPNWNFQADVAAPYGKIDIFDLVTVTAHYGHYI